MHPVLMGGFILAGAVVGGFAARFTATALMLDIPLTRRLGARGIHRDPQRTVRTARMRTAAMLTAAAAVCAASYILTQWAGRSLIYVLPALFAGAGAVLLAGRIGNRAGIGPVRRYIRRNRDRLDMDGLAAYLVEAAENPAWIRAVSGFADAGTLRLADADALRDAAVGGEADAQFRMGMRLFAESGRSGGHAEAAAWIARAAGQGHAAAQTVLAHLRGEDDKDANTDVVRSMAMSMNFGELTEGRLRGGGGGLGGGRS